MLYTNYCRVVGATKFILLAFLKELFLMYEIMFVLISLFVFIFWCLKGVNLIVFCSRFKEIRKKSRINLIGVFKNIIFGRNVGRPPTRWTDIDISCEDPVDADGGL